VQKYNTSGRCGSESDAWTPWRPNRYNEHYFHSKNIALFCLQLVKLTVYFYGLKELAKMAGQPVIYDGTPPPESIELFIENQSFLR
jgi:hypothetical protein